MSKLRSALHPLVRRALVDILYRRSPVRLHRQGHHKVLVVASSLGRRVEVNGRRLLDCQDLIVTDDAGELLLFRHQGVHVGVLRPHDGMLVHVRPSPYYVIVDERFRVVDRAHYRYRLDVYREEERRRRDETPLGPDEPFPDLIDGR
ncbi:MAG: hypothetical protein ACHREM_06350 [Polyangiales bacterium]